MSGTSPDTETEKHNIPHNIPLGASALLGEIILSFVIASLVKILQPELSLFLILFFRYLFSLPLLLVHGWWQRGRRLFQISNIKALILRTCSGFMGLLTWFMAVVLIDLSLATALSQTLPIFITILAPLILGEMVGIRRIIAVMAGFGGVAILLEPVSFDASGWGIMAGIAAPFFAALMFIFLRRLGATEAAVSTALWYNMTGAVLAGVISIADGSLAAISWGVSGGAITPQGWLMLAAIGALASFQQMGMALSHVFAPASTLAPVHYATIPIGVATGVIFFGEALTVHFIIGVVIIVSANYYILVRERAIRAIHAPKRGGGRLSGDTYSRD